MADSAVVITSGTGTNIDTRTEATNGNHRQVVVLGDPSTNAGVAPVDATTGLKVDLGADNDVTVTGTVDLGATDNAVLDAIADNTGTIAGDTTSIDAKTPALGQALAAGSVPVVLTASQLTTLTPPTAISGFATSAKQDTIIGHVDGVETLLGTIDADTSALAGAVAGTEVQVDIVSSALPAGASTAAKQPALGTAGTASSDVITVQGIASMTALKVDGSAVTQPVSGTVTANLSATDNAVLDDIAAKLATIDADTSALAAGVSTEYQVDIVSSALPTGASTAANQTTIIGHVDGIETLLGTIDTDTSNISTKIDTIAGDTTDIETAVELLDDVVKADDSAFTVGTDKVSSVGYIADEGSTDSVDEGDVGIARMTLDRKQIVSIYAHTAGGYTPAQLISAASTNATSVKGSAGTIGYLMCSNTNASPRYLKIYNKATAPTVGTDTPVHTFLIPGNSTNGAGFVISLPPQGISLGTGIAFALTTGVAVADTAAVAANEIVVNYGWI